MTKIIRKTTLIRNILIELIDSNVVEKQKTSTRTHTHTLALAPASFRV